MVFPVSAVAIANKAYAKVLAERLRRVPVDMLTEATRAAFTAAVKHTHQDSGQAAASWDFDVTPLTGLALMPEGILGVGMRGEQRTVNGNDSIVVDAQLARMEVELVDLMAGSPANMFIGTPVTGLHASNAFLAEAHSFAVIDGKAAAEKVVASV